MTPDYDTYLSDAQAVTTSAVATNTYDLGVARAVGNGEQLGVVFVVDVAADQGTGDETYQFDVEYATNAAQTTGRQLVGRRYFEAGTPTAPAQDADLLVAGFKFVIPIPPTELSEVGQYIGARYTTGGTSPSITVTTFIMPMSMIDQSVGVYYASGFTIS